MFQNFEATTTRETGPARLADLRVEMAKHDLDGFLIPRADAHQGEYVSARDNRLAWLTSFTGSAGYCAALHKVAGVFVDGRYTLQVVDQVDTDHFTPVKHPDVALADWLKEQLPNGGRVGFDPWLYTLAQIQTLDKGLSGSGIALEPCENLIDAIWKDQPDPPKGLMVPYPIEYAGKPHAEKRAEIAKTLHDAGQSATVLTQPDAIAWLLNTRGTDLGQTPVALAFAVLHSDAKVDLYLEDGKSDATLLDHLGPDVTVKSRQSMEADLAALSGIIRVDKNTAPMAIHSILDNGKGSVALGSDPVSLPKACKSDAELDGSKTAHLRDGAAVCNFLAWVAGQNDPTKLTEIEIVSHLETCRRDTGALQNISFDTICGSGPNGAIVHYRVTEDTNRRLQNDEVLLVDSGGQYLDGTTDITRTMAIGTAPDEARRAFTLVLKGMINLSRLQFPKGVSGRDVDAIARAALWTEGMDYDHGTGHGVGAYLGVHEGPQGISRRSTVPLKPGMIVSNEPGYYKEGAFGIRIENLVYVVTAPAGQDNRDMLCFKTLTCAPIDREMIVKDLMTRAEVAWLNDYHAWVHAEMLPRVSTETVDWLNKACAPF